MSLRHPVMTFTKSCLSLTAFSNGHTILLVTVCVWERERVCACVWERDYWNASVNMLSECERVCECVCERETSKCILEHVVSDEVSLSHTHSHTLSHSLNMFTEAFTEAFLGRGNTWLSVREKVCVCVCVRERARLLNCVFEHVVRDLG